MPSQDERDRVTRLEEQMKTSFNQHHATERLMADTTRTVNSLSTVSVQHSETIGTLVKVVYGAVALVLFAVGGTVMSNVMRPRQYRIPTGYILSPATMQSTAPGVMTKVGR